MYVLVNKYKNGNRQTFTSFAAARDALFRQYREDDGSIPWCLVYISGDGRELFLAATGAVSPTPVYY